MRTSFYIVFCFALSLSLLPRSLLAAAPSITAQPSNQTNYSGSTITFTVSAAGTDPLYYRWQKNAANLSDGGNISGSGTNMLVLSNVTAADSGTYSVTITNSARTTNSAGALLMVYTRLVQNGGFETGQFDGWTLSGNRGGTSVANFNSLYAHSGAYGVQVGPLSILGFVSQTIPTIAGQPYLLSLWLDSADGLTPNEFRVAWSAQTVLDQLNLGATGWTNIQLVLVGTGTNTALEFGFRNDPSYFGFDEVSLEPIPQFQTIAKKGLNLTFNWSALGGFQYQLQYKTNLAQTIWSDLGLPSYTATNGTGTNFDPIPTGQAERFYRLEVLP
jgi:hypothetical protein